MDVKFMGDVVGGIQKNVDVKSMGDVVGEIRKNAKDESRNSRANWHKHQWAHYVVGIVGVVAGATAGISAITKSVPALTASLGFAAALAVGLQSFLNAEAKARHHWEQSWEWEALAQRAELMLARGTPITDDEVLALIEAQRVQGQVTFGAPDKKSQGP